MPSPWAYESWDERKQRQLSEFDRMAEQGRESLASPDPFAPTRAGQQVSRAAGSEQDAERRARFRQQMGERVKEKQQGGILGLLSAIDKPISERLGIEIPDLPGPLDEIGNFVLREGTRPTTLGLAALGGPGALSALRGSGTAGRLAAKVAAPALEGGFGSRLLGETAANIGGKLGSEAISSRLPEGTPGAVKVGVGLLGGVAGAAGTLGALRGVKGAVAGARAGATPSGPSALDMATNVRSQRGAELRARAADLQKRGRPQDLTAAQKALKEAASIEVLRPGTEKSLRQAALVRETDAPNAAARLFYEIPGTKKVLRPGLEMPEHILESNIAKHASEEQFRQQAFAMRRPMYTQLDTVFGEGATEGGKVAARFVGTPAQAQYPGTNTLIDILENPELYDLDAAKRATITAYDQRNEVLRLAAVDEYGVEIPRFKPKTGGAYVPSVDVSEAKTDLLEAIGRAPARTSSSSVKSRTFDTGRDRWLSDMERFGKKSLKREQVFVPETNLRAITEGMDNFKARAVGNEVFKTGLGGKTLTEVVDEISPNLRQSRENLQRQVDSVRGKIARAEQSIRRDSTLAKRFASQEAQTVRRAEDLLTRVEGQTDPVIDRLVGGIDELDRRADSLLRVADTAEGRAILKGQTVGDLRTELGTLKDRLKEVQGAYKAVNPRDYVVMPELGGAYFPSAEAGKLKTLLETDAHPILRALGDVNATVLGGDMSPIVGQQGQIQWLSSPIQTSKAVFSTLKEGLDQGDLFRGFRADDLAEQINRDPTWADFAFNTGRSFTPGSVPNEFAGGWFRKLPGGVGEKFAKFNDAVYSATLKGQKRMYDETLADLVGSGTPLAEAKAIAGHHVMEFIPTPNTAAAGLSKKQADMLRTPLTSITFVQRPLQTITDAGEALYKLAARQPVTPRQQQALRATVRMTGTALGLAASTAAIEAVRDGRDPVRAAIDAITPSEKNSKFMTITLPGGTRIPLGGPYRALMRAMAPSPQKIEGVDEEVWIPFGGAASFFKNRVSPALSIGRDLVRNEDFFGDPIMTGDFPRNIFEAAGYTAQGALPITAQEPVQRTRQALGISEGRGASASESIIDTIGGFMGTNVTPQSPTDKLNSIAQQRFGRDFYDLEPAESQSIKADHPDAWERAVERGSDERQVAEAVRSTLRDQQVEDDNLLLSGQVTREEWRDERDRRRTELRARLSQIYGDDPVTDAQAAEDPVLKFVQAIQSSTDPSTGRVDWDVVDELRSSFSNADNDYIDRNTGVGDTPLSRLYRELASEYYALPRYRGYTSDQGREIDRLWQEVRNVATEMARGETPSTAQMGLAYRRVAREGVDPDVSRGVQRRILGRLQVDPARERYRKKTPAAQLISGQGPLTPDVIDAIVALQ